jgi:hypothetical protein
MLFKLMGIYIHVYTHVVVVYPEVLELSKIPFRTQKLETNKLIYQYKEETCLHLI